MVGDLVQEYRDLVVDNDLYRRFPFSIREVRDSNRGGGVFTVEGLASVYNKWSLDLGGFREQVAPGAFDKVLAADPPPHVLHVVNHDTAKTLSSTRSKDYPLELKSVKDGLRFYSRVAPTAYALDLRILMEGGVVDQSSFAFTVKKDEWRVVQSDTGDRVERTVIEVDELFDVTTCAQGAYPQTTSALAIRSLSPRTKAPLAVYFPTPTASGTTAATVTFTNEVLDRRAREVQPEPEQVPEPETSESEERAGVSAEANASEPDQQAGASEAREAVQASPEAVDELKALARAEFEAARSRYWKGTR